MINSGEWILLDMWMEGSIEWKHDYVSQRIKSVPHHTEAYVSSHLRRFPILSHIRSSEFSAQQFLDLFASLRRPSNCVEALELIGHPSLERYVLPNGRMMPSLPYRIAASVIYHGDLPTQYMDLEEGIH